MSLLDLVVAYVGGSLDSSGLVAKLKELGYSESEAQEYVRSAEGARKNLESGGTGGRTVRDSLAVSMGLVDEAREVEPVAPPAPVPAPAPAPTPAPTAPATTGTTAPAPAPAPARIYYYANGNQLPDATGAAGYVENGKWTAITGPPAKTGGTNVATNPGDTQLIADRNPWLAYMKQMGLAGKDYLNPGQRYQAALYAPWSNAQNIGSQLARLTGGGFTEPGQIYQMAGTNPTDIYGKAAGFLQNIFGLTPEQRQQTGLGFEGQYSDPDAPTPLKNVELQNLMRVGLQRRLGSTSAYWLANQLAREQDRWNEQGILANPTGGPEGVQSENFLDYFKKRYNLNF